MNHIHIRILSPKKLIFEGQISSLSSENSAGKFDILSEHANFITLIENKPITLIQDSKTIQFNFPLSIIYASKDQINVFTEIQI